MQSAAAESALGSPGGKPVLTPSKQQVACPASVTLFRGLALAVGVPQVFIPQRTASSCCSCMASGILAPSAMQSCSHFVRCGASSDGAGDVTGLMGILCGHGSGQGAVYTYDLVGNFERVGYSCQGSGKDLFQPVLDNQLKAASPLRVPAKNWMTSLPEDEAIDLIKDVFVAAGERDIYTGDAVEILVINKNGTRRDILELKKD
ncbi:hypothetical protein WJX82_004036 [Trebouxia sp. C0006]